MRFMIRLPRRSLVTIVILCGIAVLISVLVATRPHFTPTPSQPPHGSRHAALTPDADRSGGGRADGSISLPLGDRMQTVGRNAKALSREGRTQEALALVEAIAFDSSFSPAERASANAHRAVFLFRMQRMDEAIEAGEATFAIVDEHPELSSRIFHWEAVNTVSVLYSGLQAWEDALRVNDRLLSVIDGMPQEFAGTIYINRAKYLERLGRREEAARSLDSLFARYPHYLNQHAMSIPLRLQHAELHEPTRRGEAYVLDMMSVWNDPELARHRRNIIAGERLGQALLDSGRGPEAMLVYRDIADRLEANRVHWLTQESSGVRHSVESFNQDMMSALGMMSMGDMHGRADLALEAIARLRRYRTTPSDRHDLDQQEQTILRRIEGEADRHTQSPALEPSSSGTTPR